MAAPFPGNSQTHSTTNDILLAILHGGKCLGYAELDFDDANPAAYLSDLPGGIPAAAQRAIIFIEADATEINQPRVAMFRETDVDATPSAGMPIGDNGTVEINGAVNLENFSIIGITAGKIHTMRVQFYGEG